MKIRHLLLAGTICAASFSASTHKLAAAEFDHIAGNWQGRGTVDRSDGTKERLRCQASYSSAPATLKMNLKCASDSYNFELRSDIKNEAGQLSGSWSEMTRRLSGSLSGKIDGDIV